MNTFLVLLVFIAVVCAVSAGVQIVRIRRYVIRREWLVVPLLLTAILFMLGAILVALGSC